MTLHHWVKAAVGATLCLALVTGWSALGAAQAASVMNCATAMTLVSLHPGIEAPSVVTDVLAQWQAMDRQTMAAGHPAIAAQMVNTPAVMTLLARQCQDNPGQALQQASAQVYLRARAAIDGF